MTSAGRRGDGVGGKRLRGISSTVALTVVLVLGIVVVASAQGQTYTEKVLYSFTGGSDGGFPDAGLVRDAAGNLYGTTAAAYGAVFEVSASGAETVLYTFTGGSDGGQPYAGLVRDAAGNLYGTTEYGGGTSCTSGCGTVFEVSASGTETVLHSFSGYPMDGAYPDAGLVRDAAGNLYGTTSEGGSSGNGTVFEVSSRTESVLYSFTGGSDGAYPDAGLVRDAAGNLYGTTYYGGASGYGTVFEVSAGGAETVLYSFTGGADGASPYAGLVRDAAGNLYGTTYFGGASGVGTVFEVSASGAESVLHSFTGGSDGAYPQAGLVRDPGGNLYGTTPSFGTSGYGTVFKVDTTGKETVLYSFTGGADGGSPFAGLVRDAAGNLYGTTYYGGASGSGTVFELAPPWQPLTHQPNFLASTALLLTDGTVMVQDYGAADWWRLTPDNTGSYVNGKWSQLASLPSGYAPLYYASAVLADGKVIVEGGEYNFGAQNEVNLGALYDPSHNTWTSINPPNGGTGNWLKIGDASSAVLSNGTFMLGNCCSAVQALFNEPKLSWTVTSKGKADSNSEEGWTLLGNGDLLTVDTENGTESELYNPTTRTWSLAGSTFAQLTNTCMAGYVPEIGPAVLRPDGTVFAIGGNSNTAIYDSITGQWSGNGPAIPGGLGVPDGPASLLPSGNVLFQASPSTPCYTPPSQFYEFDGTTLTQVGGAPLLVGPPNAPNDPSYVGRMLLLPTGQVLFTDGSNSSGCGSCGKDVEIYTPGETWNTAWAPTIISVPSTLVHGQAYTISGTQFNGLSQGAAYGDDAQSATNYPLVQIINQVTGHVFYARTHNHSTMAVATGSTVVSTHFNVPATICSGTRTTNCVETGESTLVVVANGIPSATVAVTVQ